MSDTDALQVVAGLIRSNARQGRGQVDADLRAAIQNLLARSCPPLQGEIGGLKVSEWVDAASASTGGRREATLLFLRFLEQIEILADADAEPGVFQRRLVGLVETAAPDISEHLKLNQKRQNYEKFEAIRGLHPQVCEIMSVFRTLPSDSREFAARRQDVFKVLNNKILKAYMNPFGFREFSNAVHFIYNNIYDLLELVDETFGEKIQQTFDYIEAETAKYQQKSDFLSFDYYLPFLDTSGLVLGRIETDSSERFKCTLRPRRDSPYVLERRYPPRPGEQNSAR